MHRRHTLALVALGLLVGCLRPPTAAPMLVTEAETSGWVRTGRYAETVRLCRDFARAYPKRVRCTEVATTPEQRTLVALVVSGDGTLTPELAVRRSRPAVLVQGGIHAGEIEGKDAGFWLLRDLLDGRAVPGALDAVTLVFVPVFNVDGHERFGPNHRPNQRGPRSDLMPFERGLRLGKLLLVAVGVWRSLGRPGLAKQAKRIEGRQQRCVLQVDAARLLRRNWLQQRLPPPLSTHHEASLSPVPRGSNASAIYT